MTDDQRQRIEAAVSGALRHVAFYNLDSTDTRAAKRVLNQSLTPVIDAMLGERDAEIAKLKSIISGKTFPFDESASRIAELEGLLHEARESIPTRGEGDADLKERITAALNGEPNDG